MPSFVRHEKISLKKSPHFNEAWVHDRIVEDTTLLGLGEVRVLDRERTLTGGGRLDMLLLDDDNNRRYEVEIMLGATDPSHIVRCIEYWDKERRRYPGYDHVAVLIAEDITSRFLNVMSLLSGSVSLIAIQLNALRVQDSILLNFVTVLDQADLRVDDTEEDTGGGTVSTRDHWSKQVGEDLMAICDQVLGMINESSSTQYELTYLSNYVGLRARGGSTNNFIHMRPRRTKKLVQVAFRNEDAIEWKDRFETLGIPATSRRKHRFRLSLNADDLREHAEALKEAVRSSVGQYGG